MSASDSGAMDQTPSKGCQMVVWGQTEEVQEPEYNQCLFLDIREVPSDDLAQVDGIQSIGGRKSAHQVV